MADNNSKNDSQDLQGNNNVTVSQAYYGLNLDNVNLQIKDGQITYALNATIEGFDGNSITYQNEESNIKCIDLPSGYSVCGAPLLLKEQDKVIFFLSHNSNISSEIGILDINKCQYSTIINSPCLNFNILYPINSKYRVTDCTTQIFFTDNYNPRRYIDLNNLPFKKINNSSDSSDICNTTITNIVDCELLLVQKNFNIPNLDITNVLDGGSLIEGTYQFAIQYSDEKGSGYSDYFSVTNPVSIFDIGNNNVASSETELTFNSPTSKCIELSISNLDREFKYYNLAVIKTINNTPSNELIGTFYITSDRDKYIYTGNTKTNTQLLIDDIILKRPIYPYASIISTVDDTLLWSNLKSNKQISYQKIANKIPLQWVSWKVPDTIYSQGENTANYKGYLRDEVYAFEICFLLKSGYQTPGFHIPGRTANTYDLENVNNTDVIYTDNSNTSYCDINNNNGLPRWKVYNTATLYGYTNEYNSFISGISSTTFSKGKKIPNENINPEDPNCYLGPYQYGNMGYYESTEKYPCNEDVWGELANQNIKHHKIPDCLITKHHDNVGNIYPIGIYLDTDYIKNLIASSDLSQDEKDEIIGFKILRANRVNSKSIIGKGLLYNMGKAKAIDSTTTYLFPNYPFNDIRDNDPFINGVLYDNESKNRFTFHSPDTSFYQPSISTGNILKLECIENGTALSNFVQVHKHSKYKIFTDGLYLTALAAGGVIGLLSITIGLSTQIFDGTAAITAYQTLVDIFERIVPRINYTYQFNSIGNYNTITDIQNTGNKQRLIDLCTYTVPGMLSIGDNYDINNYQRESSIYLRTKNIFPYTHEQGGYIDQSKWNLGCESISTQKSNPISSYYGSMKRNLLDQYGRIYSYETIDTGFQHIFNTPYSTGLQTVFGGDTFINRFSLKRKLPFFTDNRVGYPDDSDIEYNKLSNLGNVKYWYSSDSKSESGTGFLTQIAGILFGTKVHNLDCDSSEFFYRTGRMYLFAYGIIYFYTESDINLDYRKAGNSKEKDFYPKVTNSLNSSINNNQKNLIIPNDWLQESNVSIINDNYYIYNKTFSKQSKENFFTHLRDDFNSKDICYTKYPTRILYSDRIVNTHDKSTNWLFYKPSNVYDLPNTYGNLVSIDGIENNQILVRFTNKTQLYNAMLSIDTNNGRSAYVGGNELFRNIPLEFFDTDQGYAGSSNLLLLKSENGHLFIDQQRGNIFILSVTQYGRSLLIDITEGMSKWFTANLPFVINKYFPEVNIDNSYNGIGITGVWDSKYDRFIFTKLDYEPLDKNITYNSSNGKFYLNSIEISLQDSKYFCNKSFTISYSPITKSWISFHTYLPNYYIPQLNYFYTGINNSNSSLWAHNSSPTNYQRFYGILQPYILEYPIKFNYQDEIISSIADYTTILEYKNDQDYYEVDYGIYFNKAILYNNQQCTGLLNLVPKPLNSLKSYLQYPKLNSDSKDILYTKSDNFFKYNTFWDITYDELSSNNSSFFQKSCISRSIDKELIPQALNYNSLSHRKARLRAKNLRIRHIQDATDKYKFISKYITVNTQKSIK